MQFSKTTMPTFTQMELFSHCFKSMKVNFNIFLPAKSPHLNTIEPLWLLSENRVRNTFPPPTSLKQLEDVLQEEWHEIPLETV
jgi:transposase